LSTCTIYHSHELLILVSAPAAQVLQNEQDLSTKRNAFQFLCNHAEERAVNYLLGQIDNVALWGDILQMAVLDVIRKVRSLEYRHLRSKALLRGTLARAITSSRVHVAWICDMCTLRSQQTGAIRKAGV